MPNHSILHAGLTKKVDSFWDEDKTRAMREAIAFSNQLAAHHIRSYVREERGGNGGVDVLVAPEAYTRAAALKLKRNPSIPVGRFIKASAVRVNRNGTIDIKVAGIAKRKAVRRKAAKRR